jgi:hypothetical protein
VAQPALRQSIVCSQENLRYGQRVDSAEDMALHPQLIVTAHGANHICGAGWAVLP